MRRVRSDQRRGDRPRREESPMDDETLITLIAAGDRAAMDEFHRRWFRVFARLAKRLTGDEHAGEDLAQEMTIRVILRASSYQRGRDPEAWLRTIFYHLACDFLRRRQVRKAAPLS